MKSILVTGGAGYIGSQAVLTLAEAGYRPITYDNLSQGRREAVLAGDFHLGDLSDEPALDEVFSRHEISAVIHFASRCCVGESMDDPRQYFEQNLGNALTLLRVMLRHGVDRLVFSSSCASYGNPVRTPMDESHPQNPINPYGETKHFIERMLRQYERAYGLRSISLRYFNAAGGGLDGRIGESHHPETHLIPRVLGAAAGQERLEIFGSDYDTPDGTCIRDYVHIADLAEAHLASIRRLDRGRPGGAFNLGTGSGYSVRQVVDEASRVTGSVVPFELAARRPGDPAELVCDASLARKALDWTPRYSDLTTILETAWNWEKNRRY